MVGCLHGNGNIADSPVNGIRCARKELVRVDDLAVTLVRSEVVVAVHPDETSEALAHIQYLKFSPQIHKSVRRGGAGKSDDTLYPWTHLHQSFEPL